MFNLENSYILKVANIWEQLLFQSPRHRSKCLLHFGLVRTTGISGEKESGTSLADTMDLLFKCDIMLRQRIIPRSLSFTHSYTYTYTLWSCVSFHLFCFHHVPEHRVKSCPKCSYKQTLTIHTYTHTWLYTHLNRYTHKQAEFASVEQNTLYTPTTQCQGENEGLL